MGKLSIEERTEWRRWVIPKPLERKPIHRWFVFPHSFTSELVHALIEEWGLTEDDHILDPFVGAGTTVLAAKESGIPATGYDLSPLAVFVSRTKIANYSIDRLRAMWGSFSKDLNPMHWNGAHREYPDLVRQALPGQLLGAFDVVERDISRLAASAAERAFLRLALLSILPHYSRAVATGGWLKWEKKRSRASSIPGRLRNRVENMLKDLERVRLPRRLLWHVDSADARSLPKTEPKYSAVITSPPYPNRHDYTRVFGVELMFGFLNWEDTRQLRYQSFHSHPEARPERPNSGSYRQPRRLARAISSIRKQTRDARVPGMLEGYFLDMYLTLKEVKSVCRSGARLAFVVGNAQYCGYPIPVDELTAELGEQVGLKCEGLLVARHRGNSAQQMGTYGRNPARESVVLFTR